MGQVAETVAQAERGIEGMCLRQLAHVGVSQVNSDARRAHAHTCALERINRQVDTGDGVASGSKRYAHAR